jgi:hypothetical protein
VAIKYALRGDIVDMVDGWRGVRLLMRERGIGKVKYTRNENSLKNVVGIIKSCYNCHIFITRSVVSR